MKQRWLILGFIGLISCNGLFYHPDSFSYSSPKILGIPHLPIQVATPDGEILDAWEFPPETPEEKGVVVHFHGNAQNMSSHVYYSQWLTELGYRVFTFDYRGYGQSTGTPTRDGTVKDGVAMLQYVCAHTTTPVFVFGQSLGGAIAIPSMVAAPCPRLCGAVVESTFSSYRGVAQAKLDEIFLTWPLQVPLSYLVSDDLSPGEAVLSYHRALLVIHGDKDPVVPLAEGYKLYSLANQPKWFVKIEGGGHTQAFADPKDGYRDLLERYLMRMRRMCPL